MEDLKAVSLEKSKNAKRIVSFDFLRGIAIIGVIGFHVLNIIYDYGKVIDEGPTIGFYILVAVLGFFGSLYPLFILVSAISNTFSMIVRIQKMENTDQNQKKSDNISSLNKQTKLNKIMKSQVMRGALLVFFGYFSESVLNNILLRISIPEPWEEIERSAVNAVFHSQILSTIGFGIIISSVVFIMLKKKNKSNLEIKKILLVLMVVSTFIRPLIGEIYKFIPGYWDSAQSKFLNPRDRWMETKGVLEFILYFFLSPYYQGWFPLFPNVSLMFLGVIIGMEIMENDGMISKKVLIDQLKYAFFFLVSGIVWYIALEDDRYTNNMLFPTAGSLVVIVIVLYFFEVRGKGNNLAKKTKFIRIFGNFTLTLWCFQWVMVFPLKLVNFIVNKVNNTEIAFIESDFWKGGLTGYQTWAVFFLFVAFWGTILLAWSKVNYLGTFEWMLAKLMGKNDPDLKNKIQNIKSIIDEDKGEHYFNGKMIIFLFMYLIIIILLTVVSQIL